MKIFRLIRAALGITATLLLCVHGFHIQLKHQRLSRDYDLIVRSMASPSKNWVEQILFEQPRGVSRTLMQDLVRESALRENFVVVITGATGGLGSALCQAVLQLGGLVFAVDVNRNALQEFEAQDPDRIRTVVADFSDFESVALAANSILDQVVRVDLLVNNAGLAYNLEDGEQAGISKQGYDICFQINYLSHFLLTEKLSSKMKGGRVIHVTSGLSFGVDGSGLIPRDLEYNPTASKPWNKGPPRQNSMAYGNSKLAQIWHSAALNRKMKNKRILSVCACPSWAATGIAGENQEGAQVLERFAFPTKASVYDENEIAGPALQSILFAMFLPEDELDSSLFTGAKYLGNTKVFDALCPRKPGQANHLLFSDKMGDMADRVDIAKYFAFFIILPFQRWFHPVDEPIYQAASYESENVEGQDALYEWSRQAVSQWLAQSPSKQTIINDEDPDKDLLVVV